MSNPWIGTITVKVEAEFTYEVDEDWGASNEGGAREMVECEMAAYLGDAFVEQRFIETWRIVHG